MLTVTQKRVCLSVIDFLCQHAKQLLPTIFHANELLKKVTEYPLENIVKCCLRNIVKCVCRVERIQNIYIDLYL